MIRLLTTGVFSLSIGKLTSVDNFDTHNRLNDTILRNKEGNIWEKKASMMDSKLYIRVVLEN